MSTIRQSLTCETCGFTHTFRINIGSEKYYDIKHNCNGCGVQMFFTLDHEKGIILNENCIPSNKEGKIIQIATDFIISGKKDIQTQALNEMSKLHKNHEHIINELVKSNPTKKLLIDLSKPNFKEEWKQLKKAHSIHKKKNFDILKNELQKNSNAFYKNDDSINDIYHWTFRFNLKFIGSSKFYEYFKDTINIINTIKNTNPKLYHEFFKYYEGVFKGQHINLFYEIMDDYFINYDAFSPIYYDTIYGNMLKDNPKIQPIYFDNIKMFYGMAHEKAKKLFRFFECIDDLSLNNPIKKEVKFNIGNWCRRETKFKWASETLRKEIRDASHHANWVLKDSKISYNNDKEQGRISYYEYLMICQNIFLSISTLFCIELVLFQS